MIAATAKAASQPLIASTAASHEPERCSRISCMRRLILLISIAFELTQRPSWLGALAALIIAGASLSDNSRFLQAMQFSTCSSASVAEAGDRAPPYLATVWISLQFIGFHLRNIALRFSLTRHRFTLLA